MTIKLSDIVKDVGTKQVLKWRHEAKEEYDDFMSISYREFEKIYIRQEYHRMKKAARDAAGEVS